MEYFVSHVYLTFLSEHAAFIFEGIELQLALSDTLLLWWLESVGKKSSGAGYCLLL